ncbi:hypothetical protein HYFRA_00002371 [Hymenoscyphus fraxineus]|uniref:Uncharacterized protein n=1 Tax=Hymenoscyphus fraxineus TaxID=746836 RepID=A0A9N9L842_9HELO|nr:hypothetical protein HYFRA_00002371 [Hymenoscyphus fraxineus]
MKSPTLLAVAFLAIGVASEYHTKAACTNNGVTDKILTDKVCTFYKTDGFNGNEKYDHCPDCAYRYSNGPPAACNSPKQRIAGDQFKQLYVQNGAQDWARDPK